MKKFLLLALTITLSFATSATIRLACPQKSVLINNVCVVVDYIQGCQTYASKDRCQTCQKGYQSSKDRQFCNQVGTFSQDVKIGCLYMDHLGRCYNCANGFYRTQVGICEIGTKDCSTYSSSGQCQNCQSGYSLIMGQCKRNELLGCQVEGQHRVCLKCIEPFDLVNGNCVINNCKSYYDYGCVDCECGFYIGRQRKCIPMQTGCIKYSRSICTGCAKNFRLKGGQCRIQGCSSQGVDPVSGPFCQHCMPGFTKVGQLCQIQNCLELLNDSCLICKNGFNLRQGKCVSHEQTFVCK